jgi:hypothetical protein
VVVSEGKRHDPDFEPSDEDLIGLAKRAFAHVKAENDEALRKQYEAIAEARRIAMERLRERLAAANLNPDGTT